MRSVANFRRIQNRVQAGAVQEIPQWQTAERRQQLVEIQLAEYEARRLEEAERIAKAKGAK